MATKSFYETLTEAVADFTTHGFDSQERLEFWLRQIRLSAEQSFRPFSFMQNRMRAAFQAIFTKMVEKRGILKYHQGVSLFTLERVAPRMRAELDRRILASANLIKLNRQAAIEKTLQRFSGWSTSIPSGGSKVTDKGETKVEIRKALRQLPFEERRVAIDQGHKFVSELNDILANDGGAIAAEWHSNWRQFGYKYRKDHKERDQRIYMIRNNWAQQKGFVKPGSVGYVDEITKPGEEVFCRCSYRYIYNLRDLPPEMLTAKGAEQLKQVRIKT